MNPAVLDAWDRFHWLWQILFGVAYVATTLLVVTGDATPSARLVSAAGLAGIMLAYLVRGRRIVLSVDNGGERWAFAAVLLLFLGVAVFAVTSASFILFMVCPLLYMTLSTRGAAIASTLGILVEPVSAVLQTGLDDPILRVLLPMTAILIVFGLLAGRYTTQIIEESKARAELIASLEESQAEVARLSREAGTAAERERLSREIHDTLAQGFTSIVTLAEAIKSEMDSDPEAARRHVELAARTARENLGEARAMVAALAPADLTTGTLVDALRRQADRLAAEDSIDVSYTVDGPLPAVATAAEVVLLRGAQEALTNIRRHAAATQVTVRLSTADSAVRLEVRDDGRGFDPDTGAGFGLRGMRARAEQVGGRLSVRSGPEHGTELVLEVPA